MDAVVHKEVEVPVSAERAFELFTRDITRWWPLATHGVLGAEATVEFGRNRIVERLGDEESTWAEVVEWDPPRSFRVAWHPGQPADVATDLRVAFEASDGGARVVLDHTGWERIGRPEAAANYDTGWDLVLAEYVDHAGVVV
jgi:hypothetical protein